MSASNPGNPKTHLRRRAVPIDGLPSAPYDAGVEFGLKDAQTMLAELEAQAASCACCAKAPCRVARCFWLSSFLPLASHIGDGEL